MFRYIKAGRCFGPVTAADLISLYESRVLDADDAVRSEDGPNRSLAERTIRGLLSGRVPSNAPPKRRSRGPGARVFSIGAADPAQSVAARRRRVMSELRARKQRRRQPLLVVRDPAAASGLRGVRAQQPPRRTLLRRLRQPARAHAVNHVAPRACPHAHARAAAAKSRVTGGLASATDRMLSAHHLDRQAARPSRTGVLFHVGHRHRERGSHGHRFFQRLAGLRCRPTISGAIVIKEALARAAVDAGGRVRGDPRPGARRRPGPGPGAPGLDQGRHAQGGARPGAST